MVHYPLFARVGAEHWAGYHLAHTRLMTSVVLPAMMTELGASGLPALSRRSWLSPPLLWAGFACAVLTWAVTFFVSVPLHDASRAASPLLLLSASSLPTGSALHFGLLTRSFY